MAKRMADCPFRDSRPEHSLPKCTLHDCLVHVVAVMATNLPIPKIGLGCKNRLPCPILFCGGVLACKGAGEQHPPPPFLDCSEVALASSLQMSGKVSPNALRQHRDAILVAFRFPNGQFRA